MTEMEQMVGANAASACCKVTCMFDTPTLRPLPFVSAADTVPISLPFTPTPNTILTPPDTVSGPLGVCQ